VFSNVLTNAAKYTPTGGEIEVTVVRDAAHVVVTIRDNGPGISADVLPHVFEPFVQGERSLDRREGGLGLGLPIVKSLVELHHGTIDLASSSTGTTVMITLPVAAAIATEPQAESRGALQHVGDSRRLLLVDDNEDAAVLLRDWLEQLRYDVRIAASADDALAIAERWRPDIAILDIGLPGMNGYELAGELRAMPALQQLRLIALTGYGSPVDCERARQAGFDHHFTKPVRMAALASVLRG
jgi:CheY-like chemotaxis protein